MTITTGMKINQKIRQRTLDTARYILDNRVTVRQAADDLRVSKSTVHKDVTERLEVVNPKLFKQVRKHLDYHTAIRHLRGGEATRQLHESSTKIVDRTS